MKIERGTWSQEVERKSNAHSEHPRCRPGFEFYPYLRQKIVAPLRASQPNSNESGTGLELHGAHQQRKQDAAGEVRQRRQLRVINVCALVIVKY